MLDCFSFCRMVHDRRGDQVPDLRIQVHKKFMRYSFRLPAPAVLIGKPQGQFLTMGHVDKSAWQLVVLCHNHSFQDSHRYPSIMEAVQIKMTNTNRFFSLIKPLF